MSVISDLISKPKYLRFSIFIIVLLLITFFSIIAINRISSKEETPEWFETYISELVMLDFDTFSSAEKIPPEQLISFGIWKVLNSDPDAVKYPLNSKNNIRYVGAKDVQEQIKEYFDINSDVKPISVQPFTYIEKSNQYAVPVFGNEQGYYPKVKKISRPKDGFVVLDINYYTNNDFLLSADEANNEVKKSVMLTLKGKPGKYKFISLVVKNQAQ